MGGVSVVTGDGQGPVRGTGFVVDGVETLETPLGQKITGVDSVSVADHSTGKTGVALPFR